VNLVGRTRQELVGMTPMEMFSASRETLERDYDAIIADNNSSASRIEGQYRHKDGSLIPIETRRRAFLADSGWIIVGTARDITERKQADEKIRRLNRVVRRAERDQQRDRAHSRARRAVQGSLPDRRRRGRIRAGTGDRSWIPAEWPASSPPPNPIRGCFSR